MELNFTKMHGLGNDFVVVEWPPGQARPSPADLRSWADRRAGIGFDQLLLVTRPGSGGADADYRVYNADGGEVEQCGNGARCIVRYLSEILGRDDVRLHSEAGQIEGEVIGDRVRINLGIPRFDPAALPFEGFAQAARYSLTVDGSAVEFGAVSVGNPHIVLPVDSVDRAPVGILGPELETHSAFPKRVNVGFMETVDRGLIRLRVFERGVGETRACGTGAAAAVAVARRWGEVDDRVHVELPGGVLEVTWSGAVDPLWLAGPATKVFEGKLNL